MELRFEYRNLDPETVQRLLELSRLWASENCSYGIVPNEEEDLHTPLAVALDEDRIVGYGFGHFYTQPQDTSYIPKGSRCFCVDELYVLPDYRHGGAGKRLYTMLEDQAAGQCDHITLTTSTKDYKNILKFYVDQLDMSFHHAFLVKHISGKNREETL